jgi:hypothetical protein
MMLLAVSKAANSTAGENSHFSTDLYTFGVKPGSHSAVRNAVNIKNKQLIILCFLGMYCIDCCHIIAVATSKWEGERGAHHGCRHHRCWIHPHGDRTPSLSTPIAFQGVEPNLPFDTFT